MPGTEGRDRGKWQLTYKRATTESRKLCDLPRHLLAPHLRTLVLRVFVLSLCIRLGCLAAAQTRGENQGGASTGTPVAPSYDRQHRPITLGGSTASGPLIFKDTTLASGLATWHHTQGLAAKQFIIETDGSGVALLDFDNDGWLDIYLVNGSTEAAQADREPAPKAALFRNNHDGTFTDVAANAGVTNERWGFGAVVADYDNDGWPDLYVTNLGPNRLYHNNRDGTFTDLAAQAGVALGGWSSGATFGDYDGDGFLDLFVPGYVDYDFKHPPEPGQSSSSFHTCQFRGVTVSCGPRGLKGLGDHLFHNNGRGQFADVSTSAGVGDPQAFFGFSGLFVDVNGDGMPDLLVANDSTPNYLYINRGDGSFEERGVASGFAYNKEGREIASMGLAAGDYLNNGFIDLAVTNFSDDYKVLFRNDGHGSFTDVSNTSGLADNTSPFLGWGVGFLDYDNDGWKDLMMVNGHVYPAVDKMPWGTSYRQRPLLFHNRRGLGFDQITPAQKSGLALATSARGAAFGDLFNNGRIDIVINNLDGVPTLLTNVDTNTNAWIEIKLVDEHGGPRDAVGASLFLKAGGITQRQDILSGGSFLSSNDPRAHFGLGKATGPASLTIHWPHGNEEQLVLTQTDKIYTVAKGAGVVAATPSAERHEIPPSRRRGAKK